jgi:hypothetical protein
MGRLKLKVYDIAPEDIKGDEVQFLRISLEHALTESNFSLDGNKIYSRDTVYVEPLGVISGNWNDQITIFTNKPGSAQLDRFARGYQPPSNTARDAARKSRDST